jgi:hypothetical protein
VDDNCQGLCWPCHDEKTSNENIANLADINFPQWLKPSAIPLSIVSGPPASGKTTYIRQNAVDGDVIIDLDGLMMGLKPGYQHWTGSLDRALFNRAIRHRNTMLDQLSMAKEGSAWFIVSAPTDAERKWWQARLGGAIVLLHPGIATCKARAIDRGTPKALAGIDRWDKASRMPWAPEWSSKPVKLETGLDGWPL